MVIDALSRKEWADRIVAHCKQALPRNAPPQKPFLPFSVKGQALAECERNLNLRAIHEAAADERLRAFVGAAYPEIKNFLNPGMGH